MKDKSHPYVIYHDNNHLFIIGDFHIRILGDSSHDNGSNTECKPDGLYGIPEPNYLNAEKNFKIREIESYMIQR